MVVRCVVHAVLLLNLAFPAYAAASPLILSSVKVYNESATSLLRKSRKDLLIAGFRSGDAAEVCVQLLGPERGSIAFHFKPSSLICVRLEREDSTIQALYHSQENVNAFVSREEIYRTCDGHCVAHFGDAAVTVATRNKQRFEYRRDAPLFMRRPTIYSWAPTVSLVLGGIIVLKLLLGGQRKSFALLLYALILVKMTYEPSVPRYKMVVQELGAGSDVIIEGYTLLNFSHRAVRRGNGKCVIYVCNAFAQVQNLRTTTQCDVVNFRVEKVVRLGREVRKNWLKVLAGIWLFRHSQYRSMVYIDRDLIIDKDPMKAALSSSHDILFPDLGGLRPDSAMFFARGSVGLKFLKQWLSMETGVTNRRDGGEEQEALLEIHKKTPLNVKENLYKFQCGRNALNRAECLQRQQVLEWSEPLILTKLAVEAMRFGVTYTWPLKAWLVMPCVAVQKLVGGITGQIMIVLLPIVEVCCYRWLFRESIQPVKCGLEGTKSISHGSFDNPVQGTFSAVFQGGVASRRDLGWVCVEMNRYKESWARWRLDELRTYGRLPRMIEHSLKSVRFWLLQVRPLNAQTILNKEIKEGGSWNFPVQSFTVSEMKKIRYVHRLPFQRRGKIRR